MSHARSSVDKWLIAAGVAMPLNGAIGLAREREREREIGRERDRER
jgi:hypothetical protein